MLAAEIVDKQLEAYNNRDLEAFMDCYTDYVEVCAFPTGEVMHDRSGPAFRQRYERLFAESPELHAQLVSRVVQGRYVIDQESVSGFAGQDSPVPAVAMYEVHDKIARVWFIA